MVVLVGDTVMLAPVPAGVPPQEPVNHSTTPPAPKLPPVAVKVVLLPVQIAAVPVISVGATDSFVEINAGICNSYMPFP